MCKFESRIGRDINFISKIQPKHEIHFLIFPNLFAYFIKFRKEIFKLHSKKLIFEGRECFPFGSSTENCKWKLAIFQTRQKRSSKVFNLYFTWNIYWGKCILAYSFDEMCSKITSSKFHSNFHFTFVTKFGI